MRRSASIVFAALALLSLTCGSAMASPPVAPQIASVTARWGMYTWDDGTTRCTLIADATLAPGFTKGPLVYARAYAHGTWFKDGVTTTLDVNFADQRLARGETTVHLYTSFDGDGGYYVMDRVRFDLTSVRGDLLSTKGVPTTNTCENA